MSDIRVCDGPGCDKKAMLGVEGFGAISELTPSSFVTVTRRSQEDLHFHDKFCLAKWTQEATKL